MPLKEENTLLAKNNNHLKCLTTTRYKYFYLQLSTLALTWRSDKKHAVKQLNHLNAA